MKNHHYHLRFLLTFFLGALLTGSLAGSGAAGEKPPWLQDPAGKKCRNPQMTQAFARGDFYRYDAAGNIVGDLFGTDRVTCILRILVCGDTIFKGAEIDVRGNCPPGFDESSVPSTMVCCDDWNRAKQSRQPCDPLTDADCDGISNQEDASPVESSTGTEDTEKGKKSSTLHADLALTIQAPHRSPLGVTPLALTVSNKGPGQATGVRLTVAPSSAKLVYATTSQGNCSVTDGSVKCEFGTVNRDESRSVSVQIRTETEGDVLISADVMGATPDMITANNHAQATIEVKKAVKGTFTAPQ